MKHDSNSLTPIKHLLSISLALLLALMMCSCTGLKVDKYSNEKPTLKLSEYFNGKIDAYGIFTDRSGEVVKRFKVLIDAQWAMKDGINTGILDESFTYSDGTTQKRIWTIKETSPNVYEGSASDVLGKASGKASGNALNWQYTLLLPVDGSIYEVQFDDWMYLIDDKVMLNKAVMSKLGIRLGEVTLSFHKN
jgi:hypothetical protein